MKVNCFDKEIKEIFETGYFLIPRFQRPYSWDKANVEDFWSDIFVDNEAEYFIGSIVLFKTHNDYFGIVDGQQRLTTITMIFSALRNYYHQYGFKNQAEGVHRYIERADVDNKKHFILKTESSYPYFQSKIQSFPVDEDDINHIGDEEAKISEAYQLINSFFIKEFEKIQKNKTISTANKSKEVLKTLNEIRDKLIHLKLIYIALDDEDDAYTVFETLNTRGKDLGASDLVKNHITKCLKVNNKGLDRPKDKWNMINEIIESISSIDLQVDGFLYHVWLSKYEFSTLKKLYNSLKKKINKTNAKQFLDDLIEDAKTYKIIFEPSSKLWTKNEIHISHSLQSLSDFRITQQTPFVLSVMRKYHNGSLRVKTAGEILETIEHFHFIHTIISQQRSSGGISKMYSVLSRQLTKENDPQIQANIYKDLKQKLVTRMPTYEEFLISFKNLDYANDFKKQKAAIKYALIKVSKYLNRNTALTVDFHRMTIEHILPQNPIKGTIFSKEASARIGNLVLVDGVFNEKLGNKDYHSKKKVLTASNITCDEVILNSTTWGEEEINKRTELLADLCYNKIFKI